MYNIALHARVHCIAIEMVYWLNLYMYCKLSFAAFKFIFAAFKFIFVAFKFIFGFRFMNQHGYRTSDVLSESAEEDNPEDDLYATYAMLHTYRSE